MRNGGAVASNKEAAEDFLVLTRIKRSELYDKTK